MSHIIKNKYLLFGLIIFFFGLILVLSVYFIPIKHILYVKEYEKKEETLHVLDDYYLNSSSYFVSIYINRGKNIYTNLYTNTSIDFYILPISSWNYSITNKGYRDNFAKYINVSKIDSYFNVPDDGYYIFEIQNIYINKTLKVEYLIITSTWTELVEAPIESDYNYNLIITGSIIMVIGVTIILYELLPKQQTQGIISK